MDNKSFWLLDISTSVLSVSLVDYTENAFIINAIGPRVPFTGEKESIVSAVDSSLTAAAKSADLSEDKEPNVVALILPPLWIGSDGKIVAQYLKLIEYICHDLDFKPMGFIANDEAIVEDANHIDSFPASFVLVNLSRTEMFVSLTYLGKVIERISKPLTADFDPSILESALIEFKTESTLPPQIIIFGDVDEKIIESIKNYSWVGKKNIETFLHFPDIKSYSPSEITQIYTRAITSQFPQPVDGKPSPPPPPEEEKEPENIVDKSILTEIPAADLGFSAPLPDPVFTSDNLTVPQNIPEIVTDSLTTSTPPRPKLKIKLPSLPKFHLPPPKFLFYLLVLSPLLILIPFFFSTARITLYLTPYSINKQINTTLDPTAAALDLSKNIIPVNRLTIDIASSASIPTTGQKTVGNKATGEAIIFNQKNTPQKLAANTILIDNQGNNFILINAVEVASSSANLDLGVITLGKTLAGIAAVNIGPEYNLPKDTQLHFKDFPESVIIAKVNLPLSGGTKNQVSSVSTQDLTSLGQQINSITTAAINEKIQNNLNGTKGLIRNSVQIKKGRIDYSREVGEEADVLTANSTSTIYLFTLNNDNKIKIIQSLLANDPESSAAIIPDNFDFSLAAVPASIDKIKGLINVNGTIAPALDTAKIIKMVSGKSYRKAQELIKTNIPRVYNFAIDTNFPYLRAVNPMPFRLINITVDTK